jgi:hypothetical protein
MWRSLLTSLLTEGEDMKTRITIKKLVAITMAVAVIAVIGSSLAAGRAGAAGRSDINDTYVFRSIIGITSEQSLRVSVGNTAISSTQGWFRYSTTSPSGEPLYESEWMYVPVRGLRFSDVSRRALNTEGEPVTGRAQVMVTVTLQVPAGSNPEDIIGSLELVDNLTGGTILSYRRGYIGWVKEPGAG